MSRRPHASIAIVDVAHVPFAPWGKFSNIDRSLRFSVIRSHAMVEYGLLEVWPPRSSTTLTMFYAAS